MTNFLIQINFNDGYFKKFMTKASNIEYLKYFINTYFPNPGQIDITEYPFDNFLYKVYGIGEILDEIKKEKE